MARLVRPPADLRGFPRRTLRSSVGLYRIHPRDVHPWWFSSDGSGRFDVSPPEGTCYLAHSPSGAFVEVFRDFTLVASGDVAVRRLSVLRPPEDVVLADCTSSRARAFGLTAAIHATTDYAITQAWASALREHGFDGVRYLLGHDPSARELGVALFGRAGEASRAVRSTAAIDDELIAAVARRYGIRVLPAP